MQLLIRGEETQVVNCNGDETILDVKAKLVEIQNLGSLTFNLYCGGSLLADNVCVADLESDSLEMTVPLLGGKVHGSLARAGKVKAQTPKVEKQEKKKKKTGRAKRRIQYNRRFVNVVQSYGRRRGPNANPNT
ncbi:ubiquitin-like FUBI-ribosomal protein eS30 fusion protein [Prorops nasuta]|uniref:ubiquitin-like FUBI-ribosomal protein eS30 fusion protein n=1 Tax=Prorops nasuta TaxID=863751 RepID=UPI0034CD2BC3